MHIDHHRHPCGLCEYIFDALVHTFCCCLPNPHGPSCSLHRGLKEKHRRQLIAWQASASARQIAELMKSQSRCVFARVCVCVCLCVFSSTLSVLRHQPSILHVELLLHSHSWRLCVNEEVKYALLPADWSEEIPEKTWLEQPSLRSPLPSECILNYSCVLFANYLLILSVDWVYVVG